VFLSARLQVPLPERAEQLAGSRACEQGSGSDTWCVPALACRKGACDLLLVFHFVRCTRASEPRAKGSSTYEQCPGPSELVLVCMHRQEQLVAGAASGCLPSIHLCAPLCLHSCLVSCLHKLPPVILLAVNMDSCC